MKFSLRGLHSAKIYDERHRQVGNLLGLGPAEDGSATPVLSDTLHTEVWGAHGFA